MMIPASTYCSPWMVPMRMNRRLAIPMAEKMAMPPSAGTDPFVR